MAGFGTSMECYTQTCSEETKQSFRKHKCKRHISHKILEKYKISHTVLTLQIGGHSNIHSAIRLLIPHPPASIHFKEKFL